MTDDRTYAADVESHGDSIEKAKHRSVDAEKVKPAGSKEQKERDAAAALANAEGQTGQT